MKNIIKFVIATNILLGCYIIYPGSTCSKSSENHEVTENATPLINFQHRLPWWCDVMQGILSQENFTLDQIQSALECECCKKRAFTTLIHFVKKLGYAKSKAIADLFIQNGITVNDRDENGNLPIVNSAEFHMLDAVNFLISLGADVNKKDKYCTSALYKAMYSYAFNEKDRQERLNVIKSLLKAGANPNTNFRFGPTPLNASSQQNLSEVFYLLLSYGADPYIKDDKNKNFFDYAKDNPETLERYRLYVQELMEKKTITDAAELISKYAVAPMVYPEQENMEED